MWTIFYLISVWKLLFFVSFHASKHSYSERPKPILWGLNGAQVFVFFREPCFSLHHHNELLVAHPGRFIDRPLKYLTIESRRPINIIRTWRLAFHDFGYCITGRSNIWAFPILCALALAEAILLADDSSECRWLFVWAYVSKIKPSLKLIVFACHLPSHIALLLIVVFPPCKFIYQRCVVKW